MNDPWLHKRYFTFGEFAIDDVLPYVVEDKRCEGSRREYVIEGRTYVVKMWSDRYKVFKRSPHCAVCGIEGTRFFLQRAKNEPETATAHFNLYADHPTLGLVLMTKDHIIPKKRGGRDFHSNFQTMCAICNGIKGHQDISNDEVLTIRQSKRPDELKAILETEEQGE